jgi:hypothetical protein
MVTADVTERQAHPRRDKAVVVHRLIEKFRALVNVTDDFGFEVETVKVAVPFICNGYSQILENHLSNFIPLLVETTVVVRRYKMRFYYIPLINLPPVLVFETGELHGSEALIPPRISLMLINRVLNEGQEVLTHLLQVLIPRPELYFSHMSLGSFQYRCHYNFARTCPRLVEMGTLERTRLIWMP